MSRGPKYGKLTYEVIAEYTGLQYSYVKKCAHNKEFDLHDIETALDFIVKHLAKKPYRKRKEVKTENVPTKPIDYSDPNYVVES